MTTSITAYASVTPFVEGGAIPAESQLTTSRSDDSEYLVAPNDPFGIAEMSYRSSSLSLYQSALKHDFGDAFDGLPVGDTVIMHDAVAHLHAVYQLHPVFTGEHDELERITLMHHTIGGIVAAAAGHPRGGIVLN